MIIEVIHTKGLYCHLCGLRQDHIRFITFTVPENAEINPDDPNGKFFRFCEECISVMDDMLERDDKKSQSLFEKNKTQII